MQPRHTQVRAIARMPRSEALVNSSSRKVVNTASTKPVKKFSGAMRAQLCHPRTVTGSKRQKKAPGTFRALHEAAYDERALRLAGNRLAERGLRRGEARDRHAIGRARDVVEPDLVAERHRGRIAAVLAADPDLEVLAGLAA